MIGQNFRIGKISSVFQVLSNYMEENILKYKLLFLSLWLNSSLRLDFSRDDENKKGCD